YLIGQKLTRYSVSHQEVDEHPTRPVGSLHTFSETTLGPQNKEQLIFDGDMQVLIIPLIGRVQVTDAKNQNTVEVGEAILMSVKSSKPLNIFNDFKHSDVHYLLAGFSSSECVEGITRFSLTPDKPVTLFEKVSRKGLVKAVIGQWNGRSGSEYVPSTIQTFAWVVQGAFEIENCLLQKADGLVLTGKEKIEFEALSNQAILIFLEMA
ncbi:MAG: hypothetical protein O9262_05920, partial [Cyclobacteriaceae bacterium]|nr:hypothetical protein [Cyclobacteriaceae bacterium]